MNENPEGADWWMASDGKMYPPELHPSVRCDSTSQVQSVGSVGAAEGQSTPSTAEGTDRIGPQFPDLFQKAMQGNHLADNISVKYDGDDQWHVPVTAGSSISRSAPPAGKTTAVASGGAVGEFSGATASKRRWRRH